MDADQALLQLIAHIADLEEVEALRLTQELSDAGLDAAAIVQACERAMREVGQRYEHEEYYLSGLIMAGEIMREILVALQPRLQTERENQASGRVLLGTVHGDIHDIGKGILKGALGCWGYSVTDLGVNVPPERFVEHVQAQPPDVIALSGLITQSYDSMAETIRLLRASSAFTTTAIPIVIGGGLINAQVCRAVGADYWAQDAFHGARLIERLVQGGSRSVRRGTPALP